MPRGKRMGFRSPATVGSFGRTLGVILLLGTILAAGGCELSENCDPETDPDCVEMPPPVTGRDAKVGTTFQTYHYVLILDQESNETGGMELDAVALVKGGSVHYADTFHECIQGEGIQNVKGSTDCNQALGPPGPDGGPCTSGGKSSVFLGGTGGSIVLSFSGKDSIADDDLVRVITCGGGPGKFGIYIGVEPKASSPHWVACTKSATVSPECRVPTLPEVRK